MLRDGYVWSLTPWRAGFLQAIGARDPKEGPLQPWLDSDEPTDLNLIRDLVRRSLISTHHRWLLWHPEKRVAYFRLHDEADAWKPVYFRWSRGSGRAVVSPRRAKERDGYTGYRHDAAEIVIRRNVGQWYVQVRPTYVFTWDGMKLSGHHDKALAAIKRTESHPSVSQALRMWAHLLVEKISLDGAHSRHAFSLGPMVELKSPRSIIDSAWKRVTAKDLGYSDVESGDDLTLFDLDDLAA